MNARRFVEEHGVVLVSARHATVPSFAAAVAGETIRGSWWAHPKSHAIFRALSALDDDGDVVFTRLVDGKLTIVHRRLWPALAALVRAGQLDAARLTRIEQEHTASGKHVNRETPLDQWLPRLKLPTVAEALSELGEPLAASLLRRADAAPRSRASAGRAARARRR
jgi:hypothetical protein